MTTHAITFENELKHLLLDDTWREQVQREYGIKQGYLNSTVPPVRIVLEQHMLRIATALFEYQYVLTPQNAQNFRLLCQSDESVAEFPIHEPFMVARVRLKQNAVLTFKGPPGEKGCIEVEFEIPSDEAFTLFNLCTTSIDKVRHEVLDGEYLWEIDTFNGKCEGLVLAELEQNDTLAFPPLIYPKWIGLDVTHDHTYKNNNLATHGWSEKRPVHSGASL